MKKLSGLIIFIVLLALVYVGFWFYKAHEVKELVQLHLKEYEKPNADGYQFKVEDVSVHGFPFNYEVKLANPRYEMANASDPGHPNVVIDGALKVGTDLLGKTYWMKQEGDILYLLPNGEGSPAKKYAIKGQMKLQADVAHPQYFQAFMHPFHGFPKAFYKENSSFQEILNEIKTADYEDQDFGLYEVDAKGERQLLGFSKGRVHWSHQPDTEKEDRFVLNLDLKDFEATEQGKALLPHLRRLLSINPDMAVDVPYFIGSGKNNIALDFEAAFPKNMDFSNFITYKDVDIQLKKLEMENAYGRTSLNFNIGLKEREADSRNLHIGFNTNSSITPQGSEAIHRQFMDSLKLKAADSQSADPESKVLKELLECCESQLQEVIPDYTRLGKMQFVLDSDLKIKTISENPTLHQFLIKHLNLLAEPYGFKSNGHVDLVNNQPSGLYEIQWVNFKEMIHDAISYFNRIHPILEKFSEANHQPLTIGVVNENQEKEIVDFFKSISKDPSKDDSTISIVVDFKDINNVRIGQNSLEQVKEAWEKVVMDLTKHPHSAGPSHEASLEHLKEKQSDTEHPKDESEVELKAAPHHSKD